MDLRKVLDELIRERQLVDQAIESLERLADLPKNRVTRQNVVVLARHPEVERATASGIDVR